MRKRVYSGSVLSLALILGSSWVGQPAILAQESAAKNRRSEAEGLLRTGIEYHQRDQRDKALEHYQQALKIYQTIGDRKGEASSLHLIAAINSAADNYAAAIQSYQQALELYRGLNDKKGEASVLNSLGGVYQQQGNYENALRSYEQALTILEKIGDRSGEADLLNNLGSLHYAQGKYTQAIISYQSNLKIFRQLEDQKRLALTLNNIGLIYTTLGQYLEALKYYQQGITIQKAIGDWRGLGTTLNNIGFTYAQMGETLKAVQLYQQALVVRRFAGDRSGQAKTLNNLGYSYEKLGQPTQALKFLEQALALFQTIQNRVGEAHTLDSIGTVQRNQGQFRRAFTSYQQSLLIWQTIGDPASERITLANIGKLLEQQNQSALAIVFYKQAVNLTEKIRQELKALPGDLQASYTQTIAATYRSLADLLLRQDRVLEAQQVLDLLKVQELEDYLGNVRNNSQTAAAIEVLHPEAEILQRYNVLQNSLLKLGQELTQLRQLPENRRTAQQQQRIAQLVKLEIELNQQFNQFIESPEVEKWVEQLNRTTRRQNISLEDLNALRDNLRQQKAVLLYPLILDDRLELILTAPDLPPIRRTVKVSRAEINRAILEFRDKLHITRNPKPIAQKLYQWLIQPLASELKQSGAQTILYAPDGQLRYIPLAALHDGNQWLVQQYQINHITARSLTDFSPSVRKHLRILAGAFVEGTYEFQMDGQEFAFSGLPFAGKEVENLARTIPGTVKLIDQAFGRDAVLLKLSDYTVIHFATHAAFVKGQPETSFILFGNGDKVTLREIENWSLQNLDLVVLSACETGLGGLGNGEEVLGLGYQFQRAGARTAIASLWSVNDSSTQVLMDAFYKALTTPGATKVSALRRAQLALMTGHSTDSNRPRGIGIVLPQELNSDQSNSPFAHPYYWAPFILIGNGF